MVLLNWLQSNGKCVLIVVGTAFVAADLAFYIFKKYGSSRKRDQNNINANKPINEVMFLSELASQCRTHGNYNIPCNLPNCPIVYMNKIVSYLSSATRTIDVCVYFITLNGLVKTIIDLKRKGIIIRVITDDETSGNDKSQMLNLRKAGVQVRSKKSEFLMHHKFAIVDRKLLVQGSANWTQQAFFGNSENIIVTNQTELVSAFINEFEKLWLRLSEVDY